jgi:murein DD-endopeptidase MepM/ murein hydrolase activator NlpD
MDLRRPLRLVLVGLVMACWALPNSPAEATELRWSAPFPQPLTVARPFEAPANRYAPGHRGVDLRARAGALVRAPGAGTVRFAGMVAGRSVVSVDSGGLRFTYEPVLPRVRAGQPVTAATVLGALATGHPGCAADCLHWGVGKDWGARKGMQYLDPLGTRLVEVRLLPLNDRSAGTNRARQGPTGPGSGPALPTAAGLGVVALALRRR